MPSELGVPKLLWRAARRSSLSGLARAMASRWPFPVRAQIVGGRRIYVDLRSSIGRGLFATGSFDIAAIEPALEALSPGATFIDIGANIGFYSVLASDLVGPTGHVYCFEIDPRPLRALRKTATALGLENVHIQEAAVSDIDGQVAFVAAEDHGRNRIEASNKTGRRVRSTRLDTWVAEKKLSRVDVIKIDVEGAEKLVLEGAGETIARFKPLILCEASCETAAFGYEAGDLAGLLSGMGYAVRWLDDVCTPTLLARPLGHA